VLSSSLDGTLRQWDIQEGTCLQTWTIGQPIESMVRYFSIIQKQQHQEQRAAEYQKTSVLACCIACKHHSCYTCGPVNNINNNKARSSQAEPRLFVLQLQVYSQPAGLAYVSVHYKKGQSGRVSQPTWNMFITAHLDVLPAFMLCCVCVGIF
jgi:hypothetical protein